MKKPVFIGLLVTLAMSQQSLGSSYPYSNYSNTGTSYDKYSNTETSYNKYSGTGSYGGGYSKYDTGYIKYPPICNVDKDSQLYKDLVAKYGEPNCPVSPILP